MLNIRKLFGRDLFNFKKPPVPMYDFAQHGLVGQSYGLEAYTVVRPVPSTLSDEVLKSKPKKEKPRKTPKQLFKMKALNNNNFAVRVDEKYLTEQIGEIKEKLSLLPQEKKPKRRNNDSMPIEVGGVKFGRNELKSILERLQNRRRLDEFKDVLDEFPHTTSALIEKVVTENSHLRCEKADDFVPDFPKEAVKSMKKYNQMCVELCNKTAIFYVIADADDFKKKNKKRDPILLAQSPFGFFWSILGAWGEDDMKFLGDL